jgi:hypothetical protein
MTQAQHAMQIWMILVAAAHERRTLTYGIVSDLIGFEGADVLAGTLGRIMNYCKENGLPPLTVLVVRQDTGLPGEGLTTIEDVNEDREAVFNEKWYASAPVQIADFE